VSNKLEAALGPINSFTDSEGEVYEAIANGRVITLTVSQNGEEISEFEFFKADATKIIALIAEAAK
jgi:hypothetical protein